MIKNIVNELYDRGVLRIGRNGIDEEVSDNVSVSVEDGIFPDFSLFRFTSIRYNIMLRMIEELRE